MKEKSDHIEDLILGNLDKFEENEPLEGHFERFEAKLVKQQNKKIFTLRNIGRLAAAAIFAFLVN